MLTTSAIAVLRALRDLAHGNAKAPSRSEIAKRAGIAAGDLDAIIDSLKLEGLVTKLTSASDARWTPNVVTILGHQLLGERHAAPAAADEVAA